MIALFFSVFTASVPSERHNNVVGEDDMKQQNKGKSDNGSSQNDKNAVIQSGQIIYSIHLVFHPFVLVVVVVGVALLE